MQGDERDLIILGIGFGPTEPNANTMSMNFGPLNREGGWRRLNVAVTRARHEMMVFTSFEPSMIDLNRTSARAVHDLRHFIEFAQRGPKAIPSAVHGSVGDYDSPFEQFVAEGLRAKGWETHPQIGVSRFRIDLGVVHPDRPGDYLVGVECDGATYHSAATARDRDKVRSEILSGLGWTLLRVWSTEWWVNRDGALERLHEAISAELEKQRARTAEEERVRALEATNTLRPIGDDNRDVAADNEDAHGGDASFVNEAEAANGQSVEEAKPMLLVARGPDNDGAAPVKRIYRTADLASFGSLLQPDSFYDESYDPTLEKCIREVLQQEAPIRDKVLVDRIARAHGFKRSGRLIRERILELAERLYHFQIDAISRDPGCFVWLARDDNTRWNTYRVPEREEDVRSAEEIPPEEILAAASMSEGDDMSTDVARTFGIRRLSSVAKGRISEVLELGVLR